MKKANNNEIKQNFFFLVLRNKIKKFIENSIKKTATIFGQGIIQSKWKGFNMNDRNDERKPMKGLFKIIPWINKRIDIKK